VSGRLDIVIVSYNTREDLARSLASLAAHPPAGLETTFVVDNASADGSADMVRASWPAVHLIALDRNVGFAAANNTAIRRSSADRVLLLNSDTIVPAGAIDALAGRLEATGAVAAGPRLADADGRPEISFGPMLSPWAEWRQRRLMRLAARRDAEAVRTVARLTGEERDVDWVSGACLLVDRAAAVAAGLLDERYFMYEEDVDFCAALRARGGRILFTPAATITHLGGRSFGGASPAKHLLYDRSHAAFYDKHLPGWAPWLRAWLRLRGRGIR
jgi:GT2 family glycosyltransferase